MYQRASRYSKSRHIILPNSFTTIQMVAHSSKTFEVPSEIFERLQLCCFDFEQLGCAVREKKSRSCNSSPVDFNAEGCASLLERCIEKRNLKIRQRKQRKSIRRVRLTTPINESSVRQRISSPLTRMKGTRSLPVSPRIEVRRLFLREQSSIKFVQSPLSRIIESKAPKQNARSSLVDRSVISA
mmetsp:Transcript_2304/g.8577  ORF Transcript_2304/g.8577 Transcript_2304/m.8577 type:complete len:184 (-) Transcript_2304:128-679(-)